jgi:deazaflavin-dependent oxidoreductase (nitroreductase family)
MAASYRLSPLRRALNALVRGLLRVGLGPPRTYLLAVPGRRTGQPRSTPVTLVEAGGQRWLVAPYGAVGWVRNARAAGRVTLSRGRRRETVTLTELAGTEAPVEAFAAEAARHPVFRIISATAASESTRTSPGRSA